ncbi:ECF-type sigma factor, partial [Roseateles saccharophilus]|uniref:ECF-type sigma factor n=1 Tax=Roseateles saccharophilus TaxID=304 RepID=UPI001A9F0062
MDRRTAVETNGGERMESVHELLVAATAGEPAASARLFETVYAELKRLAHSRLRHDGRIDGLDTTALVHESFLPLLKIEWVGSGPVDHSEEWCHDSQSLRSGARYWRAVVGSRDRV